MTPEEFKKSFDELKKTVEDFKNENDKRIGELEAKRQDPLLSEKIGRMNDAIDKMSENINKRVDVLETASQRTPATEKADASQLEKKATDAMNSYFRSGGISREQRQAIVDVTPEYLKNEMKLASVDNDPSGGYFVQPARSTEILQRIYETSPLRQLATVETISTDSWEEMADWSQNTCGWVGERQTRAATAMGEFNKLEIATKEMYAMPALTQKIIDDSSVNLENYHAQKVARDFSILENTAFVEGDGVLEPRGILTYANGTSYDQIEQTNIGATITAAGLIGLQGILKEAYQARATWLMRRATRNALRLLVDGEGRYLWSVDGGINQGVKEALLGNPVRLMADMPAVAGASLSVAYGDFSSYLIIDRIGIRVLRDPYTTKGQVLLYTTKRCGAGVRDFDGFKIGVCS